MRKSIILLTITLCGLSRWLPLINTVLQFISAILLAALVILVCLILFGSRFNIFGSCIRRFHKRCRKSKKPDHDKEKQPCNKKETDGCHDKAVDNKENPPHHDSNPNSYCKEKYDPSKGYSLDCHNKKDFPYYNKFNKLF